jgi:hypothetical protein
MMTAVPTALLQEIRVPAAVDSRNEHGAGATQLDQAHPFKWRQYQPAIILLCVRWYLRYALSYRDLEEMMTERGLPVDHATISRWVPRYAPAIEKLRARPTPTDQ